MTQARIIIMTPPSFMPSNMADFDGFYSLDLRDNERLAITIKIDDYADIGKLKQDTFKEIEVPITKKNRLLFGQIGNPCAFNQANNKIFEIQILVGDYSYPSQGLQVVGLSEDSNSWECILLGQVAGWAHDISNLKLNTLDLGGEVCTDYFVRSVLPLQHLYLDDSYPVFAPLCNYGKPFINHNKQIFAGATHQLTFNSFRYWFSPLAILRAIFCKVGYQLIAPILETEEWRRTWTYLLSPDFETINEADILNRPFGAIMSTDTGWIANYRMVRFDTTTHDPGNHFYDQRYYRGGVVGDFKTSGRIRFFNSNQVLFFPLEPEYVTYKVSICKADNYGYETSGFLATTEENQVLKSTILASKEIIRKNPIGPSITVNFDFDITAEDVKVYQHEIVFVRIELFAQLSDAQGILFGPSLILSGSDVLAGFSFSLDVKKQVIEKGDTLNFASMINDEYTAMDFLQGIAHLDNLKIETDVVSKKIYMFPEFDMNFVISGIQDGFFKKNHDSPFEATNKIQVKSLSQSFLNTDLQRNFYLKFKDSTDGYIKGLDLEQELYSKKIDLGPEYVEGENKIENPFFEPTAIAHDWTIVRDELTAPPYYELKTSSMIPFLWEFEAEVNEQPNVGYNFSPRIAIAYDYAFKIRVQDLLVPNLSIDGYVYEDSYSNQTNCFAQTYSSYPKNVAYFSILAPSTPVIPNLSIIYGRGIYDLDIPDLWELVYRRAINQAYFNIAIKVMAEIDLGTFSSLSFRKKWHLVYNSLAWGQIDIYCRLSYIEDYVIGANMLTPIELIPDSNYFDNCF